MRRSIFLSSLFLLLVLGTAPAASADPLTLTAGGTASFMGYSAGPYSGNLNGNPITMMCMSFDRHVSLGQTWQVNIHTLDAVGVGASLYAAQGLLKYQQAAWLYSQLSTNFSDRANIQGAIWNLFNPAPTPDSPESDAWLALALAKDATFFSTFDLSGFRILTPTDVSVNGPQENLIFVPEPATMLLLGAGLVGIAAQARRRRSRPRTE